MVRWIRIRAWIRGETTGKTPVITGFKSSSNLKAVLEGSSSMRAFERSGRGNAALAALSLMAALPVPAGAADAQPRQIGRESPGYLRLGPTTLGTYEGRAAQLCEWPVGEISISPTGEFVQLTQRLDNPISLAPRVIRTHLASRTCLARTGSLDACLFLIEGLDASRPLSWSEGDRRLFVSENRDGVAEFEMVPDGRPLGRFLRRTSASRDVTDTVVTFGATRSTDVRDEVRRLENAYASDGVPGGMGIGTYVDPAGGAATLTRERPSLALFSVAVGTLRALGISAKAVEEAWLIRADPSEPLMFFAPGLAANLRSTGWAFRPVAPLSRPVLSSTTGALLGFHTPRNLQSSASAAGQRTLMLELSQHLQNQPGHVITSVAANERGDFGYVVSDSENARQPLVAGNLGGVRFAHRCGEQRTSGAAVEIVDAGTAQWPITAISVTQPQPRRLVIFFQGGPGAGIEDFAGLVRPYRERGWNVLVVAYSGSIGVGRETFSRLAGDAVAALRRDAASVARYVERVAPDVPVVVHGGSFGAAPAVATDMLLRHRAGGLILMAPYLKSRHPSEWLRHFPMPGGNEQYQLEVEAAVIGISDEDRRSAFNRDLDRLFRSRGEGRPSLLIFGRHDAISRQTDAGPFFERRSRSLVIDANHWVSAYAESWAAVDRWIAANEPEWRAAGPAGSGRR